MELKIDGGNNNASLKNTTIPIKFNDLKSLISTINKNKLAAIVVEPGRFDLMKKEFVNCLNKLSKKKKECDL